MTLLAALRRLVGRSIARRLFIASAAACIVVLTAAGLALTALYRDTAQSALDEQLGVYMRALIADIARDEPSQGGGLGEPQFELPFSGWYWQIVRLDASPPDIKTSRSLFASRLPRLPAADADRQGFRRGKVDGPDGKPLRLIERVINAGDQGQYLVQVAAVSESADREVARFVAALCVTFFLLAVLLVAAMGVQVRYGLRPLRQLRREVAEVRQGRAAGVSSAFPDEIAPLAEELNLLIGANREIVERARIQVGNLAHALKTPLSVLINEADAEGGALAAKVLEQTEVMRDQVKFHLDRARAASRAGAVGAATPAAPALEALSRAFAKIYPAVDIAVECPDELSFRGEKQDFDDMAGNLIDNGGKWAHSALNIVAAAFAEGGRPFLRLTVEDDGPGLPAERRDEALRRGRRLDESKPGSGLGLSIVVDLAAAYGGRLELGASPEGGLRATLILPAVSSA